MKKSNQISTLTCLVELLTLNQLRHEQQIEELQMNLEQMQASLNMINEQLAKATEEIVNKILELENEIVQANQMTEGIETSLNALKSAAQTLDDLNPDPVPTEEPAPEPQPEPTPEEQVQ